MSGLLVTAAELAAHPEWRLLDCRHDLRDTTQGSTAYRQGHLPGAFFLHIDDDLSGVKTGLNGRHPLPDPEVLAVRLSALGVDGETQVVAYDSHGGMFAARLWWLLRWLGHDKVAVLDGGLAAWVRNGGALETTVPTPSPRCFVANLRDQAVDAGYLLNLLNSGSGLILDARSADRFRGENETLDPVGGHIPGAVNRFFGNNLDEHGCFKTPQSLRAEFEAALGGCPPRDVVQQCGSGVTACHNLLAMEVAGLTGSRLYPGSWSEWCSDPSRPVARQ